MPGINLTATPITVWKVKGNSDALPQLRRLLEVAALTVKIGTPVVVSAGYAIERTAIAAVSAIIAGFTTEAAHNLASSGVAPQGGSGLTYGSVQNQPSAVNIPVGAPMADGALGVDIADENTIFQGDTDTAHALAVTDVTAIYGLTKNAGNGQWFVDTTITVEAAGACVEVLELISPVGTLGGRVSFRVLNTYQQFGKV